MSFVDDGITIVALGIMCQHRQGSGSIQGECIEAEDKIAQTHLAEESDGAIVGGRLAHHEIGRVFSVDLHALDVEEYVQGWKRLVDVHLMGSVAVAFASCFFRWFFHLELASMRGHLHDFFTASTYQVTTTMVLNLGTSAEQPKAVTALATGVTDRGLVGPYGTTAYGS